MTALRSKWAARKALRAGLEVKGRIFESIFNDPAAIHARQLKGSD
jgi:hypothetical protein